MRFGALLLLSASILFAQAPFEIHGTVSEPGLGGIAGAQVQAGPSGISATPPVTTFTDGRGEFVIRTVTPGRYTFRPTRDGYLAIRGGETSTVVVDAEHPRADVQLTMVRPAQVSGRILSADTLEPVEGVAALLVQKQFDERGGFNWNPVFIAPTAARLPPTGLTATDRDALLAQIMEELKPKSTGAFTIGGAMPGEYAVTVVGTSQALSPMSLQTARWAANYAPDDIRIIDQEYEARFWPGGVRSDAVLPISLGSGAVASVGDILLKKTPHYRAHVSLKQGDCPVGEAVRVTLFRRGAYSLTETFPCGSELLLRGLEPGSYFLYAVSDWQGEREQIENAAWATEQFEVSDKNVEVSLTPQHGVVLEGQLVAAEGLKTLPDRLALGVFPEEPTPGFQPGLEQFLEWLPDRKFRMIVSPRTQNFDTGLRRDPVYIKQLRYNGSPLPDLKVPVNPGSSAHHLEVVLDDKFGVMTGSLAGARPQSIMLLWSGNAFRPETIPAENGTFHSGPLIPGEYRVTVSTPDDVIVGGVFASTNRGEKVIIRPGETTTINVRATGASK